MRLLVVEDEIGIANFLKPWIESSLSEYCELFFTDYSHLGGADVSILERGWNLTFRLLETIDDDQLQ